MFLKINRKRSESSKLYFSLAYMYIERYKLHLFLGPITPPLESNPHTRRIKISKLSAILIQNPKSLHHHYMHCLTDHNFDYINIDQHKNTQNLFDFLPIITKPTCITRTSATLIDNIYVSTERQPHIHSAILMVDFQTIYL